MVKITIFLSYFLSSQAFFNRFNVFNIFNRQSQSEITSTQPTQDSHSLTSNSLESTSDVTYITRIPPFLFFLLGTQSCSASALNPQAIAINGPFFQGWLCRTIDHVQNISIILIIGSFSATTSKKYDEHYIFCGVYSPQLGNQHFECFPSPEIVNIQGSTPEYMTDSANITWSIKDIGHFNLHGDMGSADFNFQGLQLTFNLTNRLKWNPNQPRGGPEGWLGYTPLLPCHYAIHSVGSDCRYSLKTPGKLPLQGTGFTHIEGNHGSFFPDGWVWSQAISPGNKESFSLIGGRFVIGPLNPINWVIYWRQDTNIHIFRTTDLDRIKYSIDPSVGRVYVEAISFSGSKRITFDIVSRGSLQSDHYGKSIFIPTAKGRETYTATGTVILYKLSQDISSIDKELWVETTRTVFPLTALEFGGLFQQVYRVLEKV